MSEPLTSGRYLLFSLDVLRLFAFRIFLSRSSFNFPSTADTIFLSVEVAGPRSADRTFPDNSYAGLGFLPAVAEAAGAHVSSSCILITSSQRFFASSFDSHRDGTQPNEHRSLGLSTHANSRQISGLIL